MRVQAVLGAASVRFSPPKKKYFNTQGVRALRVGNFLGGKKNNTPGPLVGSKCHRVHNYFFDVDDERKPGKLVKAIAY